MPPSHHWTRQQHQSPSRWFFAYRSIQSSLVLVTHLCLILSDPMGCVACQAPLSMEFSRREYWHGLPFPSPGDLPDSGIKPRSLALQADSLPSEPPGKPITYKHMHRQTCIDRDRHFPRLLLLNNNRIYLLVALYIRCFWWLFCFGYKHNFGDDFSIFIIC